MVQIQLGSSFSMRKTFRFFLGGMRAMRSVAGVMREMMVVAAAVVVRSRQRRGRIMIRILPI